MLAAMPLLLEWSPVGSVTQCSTPNCLAGIFRTHRVSSCFSSAGTITQYVSEGCHKGERFARATVGAFSRKGVRGLMGFHHGILNPCEVRSSENKNHRAP